MKFAYKLALVILSLLSLALSLGGTWTIERNFSHVQDQIIRQSSRQQLRQRYTLETSFSQADDDSSETLFSLATLYAEQERGLLAASAPSFSLFGENGTVLYSNMPHLISYSDQQQAIAAGETKVRFISAGEGHYLLLATPLRGLEQAVWLVNAYDVTPQFAERDRQIRQVIREALEQLGVENAEVTAVDKGALDCTIRARVETAVYRSLEDGQSEVDWEALS